MNSRKVAAIAALVALSLATNYAMLPLTNVKLMDMIVFVGGFCFGALAGASIGAVSWIVYGTLNPYGFSLHILAATMASECVYGIAGALVRRSIRRQRIDERSGPANFVAFDAASYGVFFGALGMLLTMVYDLVTNVVFGYVSNWDLLFAVIMGFVPFGILHEASNALFFGLGCIPMIKAVSKVTGGEHFGISEK